MIKNHNNDLSIPYKVPHFVLSRKERRGNRTWGGVGGHGEEGNDMYREKRKCPELYLGFQVQKPVE